MCTRRVLIVSLLVIMANSTGWAAHIFGGDFSMAATSTQGRYILTLNLYADANTLNPVPGIPRVDLTNNDLYVEVYIFRKRDNQRVDYFELNQKPNYVPIIYQNEACAGTQGLKTVELQYTKEVTLNPAIYNDKAGYYVIWERCCRTDGVDNLLNRGQNVGMAFTFEFPPLLVNGLFFQNSSPNFGTPNGDYICINKPFQMSMKATDADGDELKYSLVTPIQGYTTSLQTFGLGDSRSSYPEVKWAAGFGLSNIIPGNPSLSIDSKTGMLTVKANRLGRYAFAIMVEEYRDGVKIGSVRRDFQLKVIDCSGSPPPAPTVFTGTNTSLPATTVELCEGNSVDLTFTAGPDIAYQWKKNGSNIPNEKTNTLKVTQLGEYQVSASFSKKCALDTISQLVKVIAGKGPVARLTPTDSIRICNGETAAFQATQGTGFTYSWFKDGTAIPNETKNTLSTKQQGSYSVAVGFQATTCLTRDTVVVTVLPTPAKPSLTASKNILCLRDSVKLDTELQTGFSLEWLRGNQILARDQKTFYSKQEGTYQVRIYSGRCSALSDSVRITQATSNAIVFDSLRAVCSNDTLPVSLKAAPANGRFLGNGVESNVINVQKAGIGRHPIRYEIQLSGGCIIEQTRYLEVKAAPVVSLPKSLTQLRDKDMPLNAQVDNPTGYTYQWSPPSGLSNPTTLQPTVNASQNTVYILTVTSPNGCKSIASIKVTVVDLLFIPDAFSPNDDGMNDQWEIRNIDKFPEAEVFVYNRWGEVIFHQEKGYQKPWDGSYQGNRVAPGEYTYMIVPHVEGGLDPQRGKVWVLR